MELILATRNEHKVAELQAMLAGKGYEVLSLWQFPAVPEVVEDGKTFAANALKKARTASRVTGRLAMADDSGLEVDALGGRPGVYSARFAGENASDAENNQKLLQLLAGKPEEERKARFRCVIAIVSPDGMEWTVSGRCEGLILSEPRGENGFGYDPLFFVPEYGKTFAQLPSELKNRISHRARALQKAIPVLDQIYGKTASIGS